MATDRLPRLAQLTALLLGKAPAGDGLAAQALEPASHGMAGWTMPPKFATSSQLLTAGAGGLLGPGRLHGARVLATKSKTVDTLSALLIAAGATLTSGQNKAAIWTDSGALLATTADQSTQWAATGLKGMTLDTPVNIVAGTFYRVAAWYNGTTSPGFARGASHAGVNVGQTDPTLMEFWTSADTGLTTTAPAQLTGPYAALNPALYFGLGPTWT